MVDVFEANGVINETGNSIDVHRKALFSKGVIQRFLHFVKRGIYIGEGISDLLA